MKNILTVLGIVLTIAAVVAAPLKDKDQIVLISTSANKELSQIISKKLDVPLSGESKRHNDGEVNVNIGHVMNREVYIIGPTCHTKTETGEVQIDQNLMELYLMACAARRGDAKQVTLIVPYFGYARQDRKTKVGVTISSADVAKMLEVAGINRIVMVDVHSGQTQGFFSPNVPVINLHASLVFAEYIKKQGYQDIVVVSPDAGGVERAEKLGQLLADSNIDYSLATLIKKRSAPGVVESATLIGNVRDKTAIIIDDICDTGGTLVKAAAVLKANGAKRVIVCVTHAVFSGDAYNTINNAKDIDEMIVTDTIPIMQNSATKIKILSVSDMLVEAIQHLHNSEPISIMFEAEREVARL